MVYANFAEYNHTQFKNFGYGSFVNVYIHTLAAERDALVPVHRAAL